jgi:hypothetical protein
VIEKRQECGIEFRKGSRIDLVRLTTLQTKKINQNEM